MDAFLALVRTDLILYFSNKRALAVTLAAPILIAAFFGSVLGGPPKKPSKIPIAVVDHDRSEVSRSLVESIRADTSFDLKDADEAAAIALVREGKVRAAVVVPPKFGDLAPRALFQPGAPKPAIAVHYDPSQAIALSIVKGLMAEHVMKSVSRSAFGAKPGSKFMADARADVLSSRDVAEDERRDLLSLLDSVERLQGRGAGSKAAGPTDGFSMPFALTTLEVTSKANEKYNAFAHSFAGMGVQFILFMGIEIGVGLLLLRRQGIWKRLRAAPVSRALLIGSRMTSATLIATALLAGIYAAAIAFFGVRIEGSAVGFAAVGIAFALLTASFGLLLAAIGRTPEATRGIAILATLLLVMLGGAWVPTFAFPEWLQSATLVVPTRWAVDGLEAMTWRGLGIEAALPPVLVMLGTAAVCAWIAMRQFDWEE